MTGTRVVQSPAETDEQDLLRAPVLVFISYLLTVAVPQTIKEV